MKIYVSGPITDIPNRNKENFDDIAKRLRELGHTVINPLELDTPGFNPECSWIKFLKRDLAYLLECDSLCLLSDWEDSLGARLEVTLAKELDIPLYRLDKNNELIEEHVAVDVEITPLIPSYLWEK